MKRLSTFRVAGDLFGVDVEHVQEVLRAQDTTRVPLAPAMVRGLINLRGEIVPAIDLRRRLGRPERADGSRAMNVVLRTSVGVVSLLVDGIEEVLDVEDASLEPPPPTVAAAVRELVTGVYKLRSGLLLVLSVDRAIAVDAIEEREQRERS